MSTELVRLLTVPQAAERLSIGETLAYELVKRGLLPSLRLGRAIRIPADALARWVAAQTQLAVTAQAETVVEPPPHRGPRRRSESAGRVPDAALSRHGRAK